MKEPTFSKDTMNMTGPVCDGSTADYLMYCDALCAEQADCVEDAVFETDAAPGEHCAFCGKPLVNPKE
jgi:hypothetical protein